VSQTHTIGTHRTNVEQLGDRTYVRYHSTNVVEFDHLWITLDTGGHWTRTTKLRMNQASNEFDLGYRVYQRNFEWYVDLSDKSTVKMDTNRFIFPRRVVDRGVYSFSLEVLKDRWRCRIIDKGK